MNKKEIGPLMFIDTISILEKKNGGQNVYDSRYQKNHCSISSISNINYHKLIKLTQLYLLNYQIISEITLIDSSLPIKGIITSIKDDQLYIEVDTEKQVININNITDINIITI